MDVLGGWMAGAAMVAIIVAVHVMRVDERLRAREASAPPAAPAPRRVAVPLGDRPGRAADSSSAEATGDR